MFLKKVAVGAFVWCHVQEVQFEAGSAVDSGRGHLSRVSFQEYLIQMSFVAVEYFWSWS